MFDIFSPGSIAPGSFLHRSTLTGQSAIKCIPPIAKKERNQSSISRSLGRNTRFIERWIENVTYKGAKSLGVARNSRSRISKHRPSTCAANSFVIDQPRRSGFLRPCVCDFHWVACFDLHVYRLGGGVSSS